MAFAIDGPYKLRLGHIRKPESGIHVRYVLKAESIKKLRQERVGTRAGGIYIFTIRRKGSGAGIPWYVGLNEGKSQNSLHREALANDKLRKYARALAEEEVGNAWLFFLSPEDRRSDKIPELETFLIWLARQRNPRLLNTKKVRLTPKSLNEHLSQRRIAGVLPSGIGKPRKGALAFRKMIGWNRSMHTGPSGN